MSVCVSVSVLYVCFNVCSF